MKNQKGFIQIPFLIAIVVGVLVLSGGGYFGLQQYQNYQDEKKIRQNEARVLAEGQREALKKAQAEIEKLKQESDTTKEKQKVLEQILAKQPEQKKEVTITANDLKNYINGVVSVGCKGGDGSGSLWRIDSQYWVLTNDHVVSEPYYREKTGYVCNVWVQNEEGSSLNLLQVNPYNGFDWNTQTDIIVLAVSEQSQWTYKEVDIAELNYQIGEMRLCPTNITIGSPVAIIGYPAFGVLEMDLGELGISSETNRIVSEGIISGLASTWKYLATTQLPYDDYFVSAKVDSGNSGGVALSKDEKGVCLLGIPTWLSVGNFETQGIVQNIHNVLYEE